MDAPINAVISEAGPKPDSAAGWLALLWNEMHSIRIALQETNNRMLRQGEDMSNRISTLEAWYQREIGAQEQRRKSERRAAALTAFTSSIIGVIIGLVADFTGIIHVFGGK